ncbi:MAG: helicase [Acidobacteriota bacterium]
MTRRIRVGGFSRSALLGRLESAGVELNEAARRLFADDRFTTSQVGSLVEIVELPVASLEFESGATFTQIVERATGRGLSLCPLEVGPHFRLQYMDQPEGFWGNPPSQHCAPPGSITVASAPLADEDDAPKGFYLRRIQGVLWLRGYRSRQEHVWSPDDVFAFSRMPEH